MPQCAVATCRNNHRKTKGRRVRYHRFPAEDDVRNRWVSVCGRGGVVNTFNTATARVCSLHFSPHSYERDVEHELLGLPPRSRLKRGAVPDRAVPISLPSLIGKWKQPRQRQQQVHSAKTTKRSGRKPKPQQQYDDEDVDSDVTKYTSSGIDILLALGLTPIKREKQDGEMQYDLNRMHIMEDECNKPSAASTALESLPKANGSPSPCQNAVPTLDSEKKGPQENGTDEAKHLASSKTAPTEAEEEEEEEIEEEEEEPEEEVAQKEDADTQNEPPVEVEENKPAEDAEKEDDTSCDGVTEAEKMPTETKNLDNKKTANHNDKLQQDDVCSLPPSPEEDDSATSSPESQGVESKRCHKSRQKRLTSDSDSDTPAIVKKLKVSSRDYEEREHTVREYVDSASRTGLEEIQKHVEKLQQEIHTLNTLARAKEHEWNNIIRLKKVKEEMYLRLQRRRQVILLTMGSINKTSDTLDWDLGTDLRLGECSIGVEEIPSSRTSAADSASSSLKVTSSKISSKDRNSPSHLNVHPTSSLSLLKNNQNQLPVMMVPIVPGQAGISGSLPTSSLPLQSSVTSVSSLKVPDLGNRDSKSSGRMHRPILPKPTTVVVPSGNGNNNNNGQNPIIGEGRQGPILDVRSIIADYRSRHPETVPRRGRRLKSSLSPTPNSQQLTDNLVSSTRVSGSGGILSMASLALGSGSQMRTGLVGSTSEMGDISFLLNAVGEATSRQDTSRPSSADSSRSGAQTHTTSEASGNATNPGISFKDVLVQFAKLSQTEQRHDSLPATTTASKPPPYPEVTLHPVLAPHSPPHQSPSSSLLHGILTKNNNVAHHRGDTSISARPTTFSPTLARLLTAPERLPSVASTTTASFHGNGTHVSISDLLSTSKTRNEITITPVAAVQPLKAKEEEEEQEDSADRLVIDESGDADGGRSRGENDDDQGPEMAAEDVPECQGCHQRAAQFVCAGCGNQWYCSRDCQVSAWDEHSEVCSG